MQSFTLLVAIPALQIVILGLLFGERLQFLLGNLENFVVPLVAAVFAFWILEGRNVRLRKVSPMVGACLFFGWAVYASIVSAFFSRSPVGWLGQLLLAISLGTVIDPKKSESGHWGRNITVSVLILLSPQIGSLMDRVLWETWSRFNALLSCYFMMKLYSPGVTCSFGNARFGFALHFPLAVEKVNAGLVSIPIVMALFLAFSQKISWKKFLLIFFGALLSPLFFYLVFFPVLDQWSRWTSTENVLFFVQSFFAFRGEFLVLLLVFLTLFWGLSRMGGARGQEI